MPIRRAIFLIGLCGMASSAIVYVGMLAVWPDVAFSRSIWAFPYHVRTDVLAVWMIGATAVVGAWRLGSRLSSTATVVWAVVVIGASMIWVVTTESAIRASVDFWPEVGDHVWRTYIAPSYAEYAVTLFLGFASLAALTASKKRQRSQLVET